MFCQKCGRELTEGQPCVCETEAAPQPAQQPVPPPFQPPAAPPPVYQAPAPPPQPPIYQQPGQPIYGQPAVPTDNRKLFSILAYVGPLWLIGLFAAPEKNDPRVRFHVGQGMMLTIASVAVQIVISVIMAILGAVFTVQKEVTYTLFGQSIGTGTYVTQTAGFIVALSGILSVLIWFGFIALMIIGILGVTKNEDKQLPVIGKFAFYK